MPSEKLHPIQKEHEFATRLAYPKNVRNEMMDVYQAAVQTLQVF